MKNLPPVTNSDMFSEITSHGQVHENLNTETLISDENKDIEDNDESNDGWTYDPISGYWIEDAGGCSQIKNIPIPIITKERTEASIPENNQSDPLENDITQNFEETGDIIDEIGILSGKIENEAESVCKSVENLHTNQLQELENEKSILITFLFYFSFFIY